MPCAVRDGHGHRRLGYFDLHLEAVSGLDLGDHASFVVVTKPYTGVHSMFRTARANPVRMHLGAFQVEDMLEVCAVTTN